MKNIKIKWKKLAIIVATPLALFLLADLAFPFNADVPYAQLILARDSSILRASLAADGQWRFKTRPDEITPEIRKAIVFKEDRRFYYHPGVDLLAVFRALGNNLFQMHRTSGASTITMQVARMLYPGPRTYGVKCLEMFHALQLELHHSKNEILQMYLELVPYGSNIQGVKAASILYFDKIPDHLSLAEITALSIIPNRPNSLVMGHDNALIVQQRNKWLNTFREAGLFPEASIRDALAEPLAAYRHSAPFTAPQFCVRTGRAMPATTDVHTTIDPVTQRRADEVVHNYMEQLKLHQVNNACALVLDNHTHEVLAYIGSSDFYDNEHFGQVDGVQALRSPGSTLKPLLYGTCMDLGIITPHTMIADVPVNIHGYTPENYDREFRGNVTAEYALSHSLNIPAVRLLERAGLDNFIAKLIHTGFSSIAETKQDIGMSLILGGCSVQLEELTALYSAIADGGRYYAPRFLVKEATGTTTRPGDGDTVLSPAACFMVTQILRGLQRPDLPNGWEAARNVPQIAWKTGTSYGRKDAWSIGYNSRYTIGVWVGNFDAEGVASLSGASTATPLLFNLFNAIDQTAAAAWGDAPESIGIRQVCTATGLPPGEYCTSLATDFYIPGVSPYQSCNHLKEVWVTPDEHYSYCTSCLPATGYKTKLLPNIAADLAAYYEATRTTYDKVPPHNPACERTFAGKAPVITSLTNGMEYIIENRAQQKMELTCTAANDVHKVYWYINDKFFATTSAREKIFFNPPATQVKISCADDKGRNTNIEIRVRFI